MEQHTKILPYQSSVANDLLQENCQHGLVLWHIEGTGKTLTGLHFLKSVKEKFPDQKFRVLLVTSRIGMDFWKIEAEKHNLEWVLRQSALTNVTYTKDNKTSDVRGSLEGYLKDVSSLEMAQYIIIMDDAHHILENIEVMTSWARIKFNQKLNRAFKVLLMTAVPFYTKETDFATLTNIAAGREIIPESLSLFRSGYSKISTFQSFTFGWFLSVLNGMYASGGTSVHELLTAYEILTLGQTSWAHADLRQVAMADPTLVLGLSMPLITLIAEGLSHLLKKLHLDKFIVIDVVKLAKKSGPFLTVMGSKMAKHDLKAYNLLIPKVEIIDISLQYNQSQTEFWIRFVTNKLHSDEGKRIGIKPEHAAIKTSNDATYILNENVYSTQGRAIGNLDFHNEEANSEMPKIIEPPKFVQIFQLIQNDRKAPVSRVVIYSNFAREGMNLFAKFLERRHMAYMTLKAGDVKAVKMATLEKFAKARKVILLIGPELWEAVSIDKVTQMHILEPLSSYAKSQHIISRVQHIQAQLSRQELRINIFRWCCVSNSLLAKISRLTKSQSAIDVNLHQFIKDMTPDALVKVKYNVKLDGVDQLFGTLSMTRHLEIDQKLTGQS